MYQKATYPEPLLVELSALKQGIHGREHKRKDSFPSHGYHLQPVLKIEIRQLLSQEYLGGYSCHRNAKDTFLRQAALSGKPGDWLQGYIQISSYMAYWIFMSLTTFSSMAILWFNHNSLFCDLRDDSTEDKWLCQNPVCGMWVPAYSICCIPVELVAINSSDIAFVSVSTIFKKFIEKKCRSGETPLLWQHTLHICSSSIIFIARFPQTYEGRIISVSLSFQLLGHVLLLIHRLLFLSIHRFRMAFCRNAELFYYMLFGTRRWSLSVRSITSDERIPLSLHPASLSQLTRKIGEVFALPESTIITFSSFFFS